MTVYLIYLIQFQRYFSKLLNIRYKNYFIFTLLRNQIKLFFHFENMVYLNWAGWVRGMLFIIFVCHIILAFLSNFCCINRFCQLGSRCSFAISNRRCRSVRQYPGHSTSACLIWMALILNLIVRGSCCHLLCRSSAAFRPLSQWLSALAAITLPIALSATQITALISELWRCIYIAYKLIPLSR